MLSKHQICMIKRYCREPIENIKGYSEAITSQEKYHCHHINELTFKMKELIKMNMYYQRPASELVLLTSVEHRRLHPHWQGDAASKHAKYMRARRKRKREVIGAMSKQ